MPEQNLKISPNQLPILVGDIGGTNARFALIEAPDGVFTHQQVLPADNFPNFEDALNRYLELTGIRPVGACIAVAAPIMGDDIMLTNRNWRFSISSLKQQFNLKSLHIINDFKALAMSLPYLNDETLIRIGAEGPLKQPNTPKVVIGPGTGLGVATLVPYGKLWIPLPGEGGHVSFAPCNHLERELHAFLSRDMEHISYEDLLSGSGLERIYKALLGMGEISGEARTASQITQAALTGEAGPALCLDTFCGLLGSYAGDLALITGAHGGVYLGGGILPRVLEFVKTGSFRERFERKGRMSHFVKDIPTHLITAQLPALTGAAAWLAQCES